MEQPAAPPAPTAPDDTLSRLTRVIVEHLGVEARRVTADARLADDLGADSLDHIELVMAVEEAFGFEITDDDAEVCKTVQDIVALLQRLGATGGAA